MAASKVLGEEGVVGPDFSTVPSAVTQDASIVVVGHSNPLDERMSS